MKPVFSIFVFHVLFCLLLDQAQASQPILGFRTMTFGSEEKLEKIQDLKETDYILSHKYTLHFFIAGIYLSDDGYVLQKKTHANSYYPLTEQKIQEFQRSGILPSPLPKYSISIWDYLFGYSLWIILAFVIGLPLLAQRLKRKDNS